MLAVTAKHLPTQPVVRIVELLGADILKPMGRRLMPIPPVTRMQNQNTAHMKGKVCLREMHVMKMPTKGAQAILRRIPSREDPKSIQEGLQPWPSFGRRLPRSIRAKGSESNGNLDEVVQVIAHRPAVRAITL